MSESKRLKDVITKQYLLHLTLTLTLICIVVAFGSLNIFKTENSLKIKSIEDMFLNSIRSPLLRGSYPDVYRQCGLFIKQNLHTKLEIFDVQGEKICDSSNLSTQGIRELKSTRNVFFDEDETQIAATVNFYFPDEITKKISYFLLATIIIAFLFAMIMFILFSKNKINSITERLTNITNAIASENYDKILKSLTPMGKTEIKEVEDLHYGVKNFVLKISEFQEKLKDNVTNAAIAQTTQTLAHDVRKPFSMIQSLLDILNSEEGSKDTQGLIKEFTPEIKRALNSVNGMISDIMEVGSNNKLKTESIAPEQLIDISLHDLFRYNESAEINFKYEFKHTHQLEVDKLKVLRVFSNILANAIQAMNQKGAIWIQTREIEKNNVKLVEFCLGNSGSYIDSEDLSLLFDAFFTKNKKNGTGLGLAIAKKIVTCHGGEIFCRSTLDVGVEFIFTLPISECAIKPIKTILPENSKSIYYSQFRTDTPTTIQTSTLNPLQETNEDKLFKILERNEQKLKVLTIDDESLYCMLINNHIEDSVRLKQLIEFKSTHTIDHIDDFVFSYLPDLILLDVDLKAALNGFEVSKKLRSANFNGMICIHSNRGLFDVQNEFSTCGANLMLPKPLSKEQVFNLLLSIARDKNSASTSSSKHDDVNQNLENSDFSYGIFLDDDFIFRMSWEELSFCKILSFSNPSELLEEEKKQPGLIKNAKFFVFDNDFGGDITGIQFARQLRVEGVQCPFFLSSLSSFGDESLSDFSGTISKIPTEATVMIEQFFSK